MLIIPFDMDNKARQLPVVTLTLAAICVAVFVWQQRAADRFEYARKQFCREIQAAPAWLTLRKIEGSETDYFCDRLFSHLHRSGNRQADMMDYALHSRSSQVFKNRGDEVRYLYDLLDDTYRDYLAHMPHNPRRDWMYRPLDPVFGQMITASISHGSFRHLAGNMLFFLVFACTLEILLGHLAFVLFLVFAACASHLGESYAVLIGFYRDLPSLGLSGVISGVMTLLAVLLPWSRITFVAWSGFFVIPLRIPVLFLVGWYVYWDYYNMNYYGADTCVGYVAHVSGAASGALVGVLVRLLAEKDVRRRARAIKGLF